MSSNPFVCIRRVKVKGKSENKLTTKDRQPIAWLIELTITFCARIYTEIEHCCTLAWPLIPLDLYEAFLPEFVRPGDIFMHDGAPVHRAHVVIEILQQLEITVMVWPPYSPDLNPIENLWAIMKQQIYKLYPELEHARDTEDTRERLIAAAKEAWQAIDEQVCIKLSETMPHRVKAVIEADGWYTKY